MPHTLCLCTVPYAIRHTPYTCAAPFPVPLAPCPVPHAPYSVHNAPCPMPHAPCPVHRDPCPMPHPLRPSPAHSGPGPTGPGPMTPKNRCPIRHLKIDTSNMTPQNRCIQWRGSMATVGGAVGTKKKHRQVCHPTIPLVDKALGMPRRSVGHAVGHTVNRSLLNTLLHESILGAIGVYSTTRLFY